MKTITSLEKRIAKGLNFNAKGADFELLIKRYYSRMPATQARMIVGCKYIKRADGKLVIGRGGDLKPTLAMTQAICSIMILIKESFAISAKEKALNKIVAGGHQFNFNDLISGRIYTTAKGWHKMPKKVQDMALELYKEWFREHYFDVDSVGRMSLENLPKQYGILGRLVIQQCYNNPMRLKVRYIAGQCQTSELRTIRSIIKEEC